ncbi:MAG: TolC family protein [Phaeodactylibacter sp.]|nr:TolC family protein [Phaeodactylibacter sp.]MCB9303230.1 TolC family protein [Lewinellaceae bacterium]HQU58551.1 TolC family protein [Saprospiraceae bacterium]
MKNKLILLVLSLGPFFAFSQPPQTLKLEDCYEKAKANYPLYQQSALLAQATQVQLDRIHSERLPQISWNAQASLQTENVKFPFDLPIPGGNLDLPLYRFQTTADLQYTIYDGGMLEARQKIERANLAASQQQVVVELDKLKAQANQYIFGILLQREKIDIQRNALQTLEDKIKTLEAAVRHGVALEGDVDKLKVEVLRLQSETEQAQGNIRALVASLSDLIGEPLSNDIKFELPGPEAIPADVLLQRPELKLFAYQKESILAREDMIAASWRPKVGAFVQAGIGAPNPLNFFDDSLSPFAMGGVKFSWNFIDWKQASRDRQLLSLNSQLVDTQRATFEANINRMDGKYREDVATLETLISRDEEIAQLQERILRQISAQLDQGVATSTDYVTQSNALQQAQLNRQLHELQLLQTRIDYLAIKGSL